MQSNNSLSPEERAEFFAQVASRLIWAVHIGQGDKLGVNGVVVHRNELEDALLRAYLLGASRRNKALAAARRDALEEAAKHFERIALIGATRSCDVSEEDGDFFFRETSRFPFRECPTKGTLSAIATAIRALSDKETTSNDR